jgi:hypothetical protein
MAGHHLEHLFSVLADLHHDNEADHFWRAVEPAERVAGLFPTGHFTGLKPGP